MTLNISIPDGLDDHLIRDLDQAAREAIAVRLYSEGKLLHKHFAQFLDLDRWQADEVRFRHGIAEMTPEELRHEHESVRRMGN